MPPSLHLSRRNELVALNTGLVHAVVRSVGVEPSAPVYDDCVQEGMIGLCRAAERFDPKRGVAFSSFAWPWVSGAVKTCLCRSSVVSEPVRRVSRRAAENARGKRAAATHARTVDLGSQASSGAVRLPESLVDRDTEDDLIAALDAAAVPEAIAELPRAERAVIKAALLGTPVSHYARRRGWSREKASILLKQATETITDWAAEAEAEVCPPPVTCPSRRVALGPSRARPPAMACVGWVQLVFSFMLWRTRPQHAAAE